MRPAGYPIQQARYAGAAGRNARQPPAQSPSNVPSRNPSIAALNPSAALESARREAVRRQQAAIASGGDDASVDGDSGRSKDGARRRSFGEDAERRQAQIERDRKATEDRRRAAQVQQADDRKREESRAEAKAREEARIRDESRAKEEVQARLKVEQIKVEQVRAQAEMAARAKREALRDRERAKQKEEFDQLKRDKLELDRRSSERDRIREERRAQERARLEGNRKEQMEVVQEKLGSMNEQLSRIDKNPRPRGAPDRAEEKSDELSARDRVMQRRQEKEARDQSERADQLRQAENENRRIRQEASNNMHNKVYGESNSPNYEFDADRGKASKSRMDAGELNDKLNDITKGKGAYDDHRSPGNADYDSGSEEDNESIFDEAGDQGAPNAEEEDEDMERREEELRAELNFATCRVEELKRTLQETKSFLGPRLPTRGKDAPPTAKPRDLHAAEDVFSEEVEEDDEDFDFDESDSEVSIFKPLNYYILQISIRSTCALIIFVIGARRGFCQPTSCVQQRTQRRPQAGDRRHRAHAGDHARSLRRPAGPALALGPPQRPHRALATALHRGAGARRFP